MTPELYGACVGTGLLLLFGISPQDAVGSGLIAFGVLAALRACKIP